MRKMHNLMVKISQPFLRDPKFPSGVKFQVFEVEWTSQLCCAEVAKNRRSSRRWWRWQQRKLKFISFLARYETIYNRMLDMERKSEKRIFPRRIFPFSPPHGSFLWMKKGFTSVRRYDLRHDDELREVRTLLCWFLSIVVPFSVLSHKFVIIVTQDWFLL